MFTFIALFFQIFEFLKMLSMLWFSYAASNI